MNIAHFVAFAPVCPVCRRAGRGAQSLALAVTLRASETQVSAGILHCPQTACRHEYPIIDGIPVIVPDLRRLMAERGVEVLVRDDIDPMLESLLGDAIGPDSWFDSMRQMLSTYGWDAYADLDPAEAQLAGAPQPGAARRCLSALLALASFRPGPSPLMLDLGCAAGRTSFDLAASFPDALVLGCDINLGLLRLAQGARAGEVSYPRRRIGLVYDRRRFPAPMPGAQRVDFWACDANCLPFPAGIADLAAALNLLDCVPDPAALLAELARCVCPAGPLLLATPFDWATRATAPETWIGGHSQRGPDAGAAAPALRNLLASQGWHIAGEAEHAPWQTRLHERSVVQYDAHLLALSRADG
jgi:SAM-dependent methyltransferase/uncharacterized protein YbaR (Trm112 family)